jgi:hypothetical protein
MLLLRAALPAARNSQQLPRSLSKLLLQQRSKMQQQM